ncbi:MAG TPA: helix-turn-helix domain-containing protein [Candidatus Thermoplasmatota archaeon]|nr:helix-turn-helix domain-containing protein [Candidatus Thermoplasmatota archaeon]
MENLTLPKLLMDEYNLKILSATTFKPRSARELSYIFGIPLASCYRKIKELEDEGLIKAVSRELTREGKRYSKYQSQVGSVRIAFEGGRLKMQLNLAWRQPIEIEETPESMMQKVEKPSPIITPEAPAVPAPSA